MKKYLLLLLAMMLLLAGCQKVNSDKTVVAATTKPVYQFASALLMGTDKEVQCVVTESVSCLHDYTLTVNQMKLLERADLILINGGGLEDFMKDAFQGKSNVVDNEHKVTFRDGDPHIWLHPQRTLEMVKAMRDSLVERYPADAAVIEENFLALEQKFVDLIAYAEDAKKDLNCAGLVTFHDGFSYFAEFMGVEILASMEEEHGSEVAAKDLIAIIDLVNAQKLPAIFTEENGAVGAAKSVSKETGAKIYTLDMAMGERDYFTAMKHNIDTVREAFS